MPEMTKPNAPATAPATAAATDTAKKRQPRQTGPALDLGSLTIDSAAAPVRAGHGKEPRFAKPEDNPFYGALKESMRTRQNVGNGGGWRGEGKRVVVLNSQVAEVTNLIQYAATALGCGRAVQPKQLKNGKTEVVFCAQSKRERKSKTTPDA